MTDQQQQLPYCICHPGEERIADGVCTNCGGRQDDRVPRDVATGKPSEHGLKRAKQVYCRHCGGWNCTHTNVVDDDDSHLMLPEGRLPTPVAMASEIEYINEHGLDAPDDTPEHGFRDCGLPFMGPCEMSDEHCKTHGPFEGRLAPTCACLLTEKGNVVRFAIGCRNPDHAAHDPEGRLAPTDLRAALQGLYDFLPRYSCKSDKPDGCPVCVARAALKGTEDGLPPCDDTLTSTRDGNDVTKSSHDGPAPSDYSNNRPERTSEETFND